MPEFISERGDVLVFSFVRDSLGALTGSGPLMLLLRDQVSLIGVLTALPGAFISGQVIFFAVVLDADAMRVGGKVTAFSRYLL